MDDCRTLATDPARRPRLTAGVVVPREAATSASVRLDHLLDGSQEAQAIEVLLFVTGAQPTDDLSVYRRLLPSAAGSLTVLPLASDDDGAAYRLLAEHGKGELLTLLRHDDRLSEGYLPALAAATRPLTIGLAGPAGEPSWVRPRGAAYPAEVLRDVVVPTGLGPTVTAALLAARVRGDFRHQLVEHSEAPAVAGATLTPAAAEPDLDVAVAGLAALERPAGLGEQLDPAASAALRSRWTELLREAATGGSADPSVLLDRLRTAGATAAALADTSPEVVRAYLRDQPLPELRLVVVVGQAQRTRGFSSAIQALAATAARITVLHGGGEASTYVRRHATVVDAVKDPDRAGEVVAEADLVITVGRDGATQLKTVRPDAPARAGLVHLHALLLARAAYLGRRAPVLQRALPRSAELVQASRLDLQLPPWTWAVLALRLIRVGAPATAEAVLQAGLARIPEEDHATYGLPAVAGLVRSRDHDAVSLRGPAEVAFERSDAAEAAHDHNLALLHYYLGVRLLFETNHHSSVSWTPLVADPDRHLGRMRRSLVHEHLVGERPGARSAPVAPTRRSGRGSAVVIEGAFPKFAGALVDALEAELDVTRVDLGGYEKRFHNVQMDPITLGAVDAHESTGTPLLDDSLVHRIREAEVVAVDWADKGLATISRVVPEGTRLVVRIHGVDTLSAWAHLVRWERVDAVIAPSQHIADALIGAVGPRLQGIPVTIVANPVDLTRLTAAKDPEARRTLGLVGWAQRVKEPTFALETLAVLRAHDPRWRLRLVGADFRASNTWAELEAAQEFRERLCQADVMSAVDFIPFTDDVPAVLAGVGWALSTSRRESFHLGLHEMAASAAVPVVRDWPVYRDGASGVRELVPADWVVTDPQEAADRILRIDRDDRWQREGLAAREHVATHYDAQLVHARLRAAVLGTDLPPPPADRSTR